MATIPFSDIALDLEYTAHKQRQCGQAIRALATLTEPEPSADPKATMKDLQRDDLHALLSVIADQALLLASEVQDHLKSARRLCA